MMGDERPGAALDEFSHPRLAPIMFLAAIRLALVAALTAGIVVGSAIADEPRASTGAAAVAAETETDGPLFVAVGYALRRMVSSDGRQWQLEQAFPEKGEEKDFLLRGVAYGGGKIVAVGGSKTSRILISDSRGRAWQDVSVMHNWLGDVAYGNERFVAVGYRRALHSADGVSWLGPTPLPAASWRRIAFGNGTFVAVGAAGTTDKPPGFYAASTDGVAWNVTPSAGDVVPRSIVFGHDRFVAVGSRGLRETSGDGVTWENRTLGEADETLLHVLWTGREFIAWGLRTVYTSPDGVQWSAGTQRMPSQAAFGAGVFAGCSAGRFSYSADGKAWTPTPTREKFAITKIIFIPPNR
jgi:hypothetical protein